MNQKLDTIGAAMATPGLRLLIEVSARAGDAQAQNDALTGQLVDLWQVLTPAQRLVLLNRPANYALIADSVQDFDEKIEQDQEAIVNDGRALTYQAPLLDRLIYEFPALALDGDVPGTDLVNFVSQEVAKTFPERQV